MTQKKQAAAAGTVSPVSPDEEGVLEVLVRIPTFGKPHQQVDTAAALLESIQLSIHSQAEAWRQTPTGNVPIEKKRWRRVD